MKVNLQALFKRSLALIALLTVTLSAFAQPGGSGDPLPCDPDDINGCAPLDTWVIALVVIGLCYGLYQLNKKQKAFSA